MARVGKQHPSDADLKRLEEENSDLRKKVSAQREATKVEHKNVERLRSEVAHLKAKAAAHRSSPTPVPVRAPTSTLSRSQVDQLRADHSQEIRELKRKHQQNLDELNKGHRSEIAQLKREHQAELAQKDKMALQHETQQLNSADHNVENLKHEIDDLKQKNTSFRLKNTELREQNGNLEKQLRDAEQRAAAVPAASAAPQDDLTELKGVGPKVARALQAAGITTFGQIAAWTESDIDDIAPKIKTAAGRIRNNDWVAQAKHRVS